MQPIQAIALYPTPLNPAYKYDEDMGWWYGDTINNTENMGWWYDHVITCKECLEFLNESPTCYCIQVPDKRMALCLSIFFFYEMHIFGYYYIKSFNFSSYLSFSSFK